VIGIFYPFEIAGRRMIIPSGMISYEYPYEAVSVSPVSAGASVLVGTMVGVEDGCEVDVAVDVLAVVGVLVASSSSVAVGVGVTVEASSVTSICT
jgi:hypothetical protein